MFQDDSRSVLMSDYTLSDKIGLWDALGSVLMSDASLSDGIGDDSGILQEKN
jgi:hypothetical protein